MRILIVAPYSLDVPGGNSTSIRRLIQSMRSCETRSCETRSCETTVAHGDEVEFTTTTCEEILSGGPDAGFDLVHAFHARRAGSCALEFARRRGVPMVVTLTGTDVSQDAAHPVGRPIVKEAIAGADGVIALRQSLLAELEAKQIELPELTAVIPQGIEVGAKPFDLRASLGLGLEAFVALVPGGLRPVKAQHLAFAALAAAVRRGLALEVVFIGPSLDQEYADSLQVLARSEPHVHFAGTVRHEQMRACYEAADVIWNTSDSEGESNAILEALHIGRPVIARRNAGNAALIDHGENGWLFDTPEELDALTQHVRDNTAAANRIAKAGRERTQQRADPQLEAQRHAQFYRAVLAEYPLTTRSG